MRNVEDQGNTHVGLVCCSPGRQASCSRSCSCGLFMLIRARRGLRCPSMCRSYENGRRCLCEVVLLVPRVTCDELSRFSTISSHCTSACSGPSGQKSVSCDGRCGCSSRFGHYRCDCSDSPMPQLRLKLLGDMLYSSIRSEPIQLLAEGVTDARDGKEESDLMSRWNCRYKEATYENSR